MYPKLTSFSFYIFFISEIAQLGIIFSHRNSASLVCQFQIFENMKYTRLHSLIKIAILLKYACKWYYMVDLYLAKVRQHVYYSNGFFFLYKNKR